MSMDSEMKFPFSRTLRQIQTRIQTRPRRNRPARLPPAPVLRSPPPKIKPQPKPAPHPRAPPQSSIPYHPSHHRSVNAHGSLPMENVESMRGNHSHQPIRPFPHLPQINSFPASHRAPKKRNQSQLLNPVLNSMDFPNISMRTQIYPLTIRLYKKNLLPNPTPNHHLPKAQAPTRAPHKSGPHRPHLIGGPHCSP